MALPSACPPPDFLEEVCGIPRPDAEASVKLRLAPFNIFLSLLVDWYGKKVQAGQKIKKKLIINQAKIFCRQMCLSYDALPTTWLRTLCEKHNVDFHYESPIKRMQRKAGKELVKAVMDRKITDEEMNTKLKLLKEGKVTPEMVLDELRREDPMNSKPYALHDLTKEPPPAFWSEAFAKGICLPRTLKVVAVKDHQQIIAFYDYSNTQGLPSGWSSKCHESNNYLDCKMY